MPYYPAAHAAGYKYVAPPGLLQLGIILVDRIFYLALSMLFIVPPLLRGFFEKESAEKKFWSFFRILDR